MARAFERVPRHQLPPRRGGRVISHQEVVAALARAGRIPESVAAAALAVEETSEFRRMWPPCLNGELHPASVAMARAALGTIPGAGQ